MAFIIIFASKKYGHDHYFLIDTQVQYLYQGSPQLVKTGWLAFSFRGLKGEVW